GTGTISQVISKKMAEKKLDGKIFGVEIVESAVADAKVNAERNKLGNVEFLAEDVNVFLKKHEGERPPIIVLDPPRAGIAPKALKKIVDFGPEKIVYISCNPATMARDTEILAEKYKLKKLSIVDQFPHTNHIECVGEFVLKKVY
ncbi:MAG: methyltransferase domain-containing protein, partial [Candidatus Peregrinibacteria bacterium]|nr:methyltransferase domain-containing protein [Candidatus Peregrinibacteria bacterium]